MAWLSFDPSCIRCLAPATLSALLVSGCAGSGEGLDDNGRPIDERPAGTTSVFREIQDTVFTPACTQCHAGAGAPLGLRLDDGNSYAMLVGVPSSQVPSLLRVEPGDPAVSYLVRKIEGRASVGGRMPLGGPALPQDRIDLIRQWIAAGAPADGAAATGARALSVVSTAPAAGEQALAPLESVMLVFDAPVDAALAAAGTFELAALGEGGGIARPAGATLARLGSTATVSPVNPTVVRVEPAGPLGAGRYRLRLSAEAVPALADVDGRVLDGDGDGEPGGDFVLDFEVIGENPQ